MINSILGEAYKKLKDYDNAIKQYEIYLVKEISSNHPWTSYPWYDLCRVIKKKYKKIEDFKNASQKYKDIKFGIEEFFKRNDSETEELYKKIVTTHYEGYFAKEIKIMEAKSLGKTKPKSVIKEFDKKYVLLKDMITDKYFPPSLVTKIIDKIEKFIEFLESGERTVREV